MTVNVNKLIVPEIFAVPQFFKKIHPATVCLNKQAHEFKLKPKFKFEFKFEFKSNYQTPRTAMPVSSFYPIQYISNSQR